MSTTYPDISLEWGDRKVSLCHIGEGYDGNYNPEDPEDTPLMRFDIYERVNGEWEAMDDASYCTAIPATVSKAKLSKALLIIMEGTYGRERVKKAAEGLSWLTEGDLR
jgi:hypothetical protein